MSRQKDKQTLWHRKVFDFNCEEFVLPNGKSIEMGVIRHPGSSAIIPVFEDGSVLLVYQYRPAVDRYIYEIPSGTMLPGEEPLECAKRELREECGFRSNQFEKMGEILIAPWYSDERIYLFMATGLMPCEQKLDEDEILTTHIISFDQAMKMVERGEIRDATTMIGLQIVHSILKRK